MAKIDVRYPDAPSARSVRTVVERPHARVSYVRLSDPAPYDFDWDGKQAYLALHDIILIDGEMSVSDVRCAHPLDIRGLVTFTPEGAPISGWAKPQPRDNTFTALSFDTASTMQRLGRDDAPSWAPRLHIKDEALAVIMLKFQSLIQDESIVDDVLVDALVLMAAAELLKGAVQEAPSAPGALAQPQLKRVREFVEMNIAQSISLDELAREADLSPFHFIRSFKAATGVSPYKYLLTRRVERAKDLIRQGLSMRVVAESAGFTSQSQFSRTFGAIAGQSPRDFRRRAAAR